jgi:hypothetical protein
LVEAETLADEHGVPFLIVYGISGNPHRFWSLAGARDTIGYTPADDSQVNFADKIAAPLSPAPPTADPPRPCLASKIEAALARHGAPAQPRRAGDRD